jgi:4-hydroxy-2-oxoheptanedioate aldolase
MVYIGVYDLSVALGCAGNIDDPRITQIVTDSINAIRAAGKAAGMMVRNAAEITNALALGANVLVYGVDTSVIHQAMSGAVDAFRQAQAQLVE